MIDRDDALYLEAIHRFRTLYDRALAEPVREPTATVLATADARGRPSARTVLLKEADERGFVFYTNSRSRKGRALEVNPRAAMLFFWPGLFEQVEVEGQVEKVDPHEADRYWQTRPRESQLGAWASRQSEPLQSRAVLEARVREVDRRYAGREVPRPTHWNGYRLLPDRVEFWQTGPYRLNNRQCYAYESGGWRMRLLNP